MISLLKICFIFIYLDSEAALLPADCDVDLAATGDWLVNDTDQSPVKKKPRISDPPTCNTR